MNVYGDRESFIQLGQARFNHTTLRK